MVEPGTGVESFPPVLGKGAVERAEKESHCVGLSPVLPTPQASAEVRPLFMGVVGLMNGLQCAFAAAHGLSPCRV